MKRILAIALVAVFVIGSVLPLYGSSQNTITLTIASSKCTVNGEDKWMDVAPFVQNGRTFVPIRFVSEALGAKVDYTKYADGTTKDVIISMEGVASTPLPTSNEVVVVSERGYVDDVVGWYHVVGEVQNNTGHSVSFVEIVGTFYSTGGSVVTQGTAYSKPTDLQPGPKAPFEILAMESVSNIDHYSLTVTWQ
jgi:hypothetical protein